MHRITKKEARAIALATFKELLEFAKHRDDYTSHHRKEVLQEKQQKGVCIMPHKGLNQFVELNLDKYLEEKRTVFLKAEPWEERNAEGAVTSLNGSKVTIQIIEDKTKYSREDTNNFGSQIVVKIRNQAPSTFAKLKPFGTEVQIVDVEKASVWGDYRNEISLIAAIKVKGTE